MCGVVGIASGHSNGFSNKEANTFFDMLYFDALRGFDSTGVFGVDKHSNVNILKEASQAGIFIENKAVGAFKTEAIQRGLFLVGHNRAATRGEIKDENAHPFWVDDKVVLVQNGTWRGDHKKIKDVEVDTEALAHIIAENADIEEALCKVQAAYALTWFNTDTHSLHLIRNYERPLWLAKTESNGLIWCSEPGFLMLAAARHELKLAEKPTLLDPHQLVTLTIKDNNWVREDKKVNPFRHYQTTTKAENDEDSWDNIHWPYVGGKSGPNVPTPVNRPPQGPDNPTYIASTFAELASEKLNEYHLTKHVAALTRDAACDAIVRNKNKNYIVELDDFLPANNNPLCSTWHVYGKAIVPPGDPLEQATIHWFEYNKTKEQILDFVTEGFFDVQFAACRHHTFNDKIHIVSIMASNATLVETQTTQVQ